MTTTHLLLRVSWVALCALPSSWRGVGAQGPSRVGRTPEITIGRNLSVWSEILGEARPLQIYLPPSYDSSRDSYPVLYLLDGDRSFHHVTGIVEFLSGSGRIPEMIVVSVPNTDRSRDLTPPAPGAGSEVGGRADRFLRYLTDELAGWVGANHRTQPFRVLVGHSRGGLFAIYALVHRPESFHGYIAASPALWWNNRAVIHSARARLKRVPPPRFLYLTAGHESRTITETVPELTRLLEEVKPAGLEWKYRHLENENHYTTPHETVYDGLQMTFAGWQVPESTILASGLEGVEAHYAAVTRKYGFPVRPPKGMMAWIGDFLLQQEKIEEAIAVRKRTAELYPRSAEVHFSLGGALERARRHEEASAAYRKAYSLLINW